MIIKSNRELKALYGRLGDGDFFLGTIASMHLKQTKLLDLLERGVCCLPSALCQVLNGSKVSQAFILQKWMIPQTSGIHRRMDLIKAISGYGRQSIGPVISKQDHMHCGHGVRRWDTIEVLYNHMGFTESSYPFVLQPYVENFLDVRVIMVADYVESYIRHNPYNFRDNLSTGGKSRPLTLEKNHIQFCRSAMERGKFPYAHIDLMIMDTGEYYLSEISLNGGTKGAKIDRKKLDQKKQSLLERLMQQRESAITTDPPPLER